MKNTTILSYILSLIGFGSSKDTLTNKTTTECNFLSESTFIVNHPEDEKIVLKNEGVVNTWLNQLSNATLCQILTTAITEYPQITETIQSYYFGNNPSTIKQESWITQLIQLRKKAHTLSRSLDNCRISEQFSRASDITLSLHLLLSQFTQNASVHGPSHVSLFGLVLIAQESLSTPTEVRQHMFSHEKFGRVIILEMASVLKNFKFPLLPNADWNHIVNSHQDTWLLALENVCLKLARYDVTWEYRKEYQDVPTIAARYYKNYDY